MTKSCWRTQLSITFDVDVVVVAAAVTVVVV